MMRKKTFSHITIFFLLSSAVVGQSNSPPAAPPSAPLPTWDASFAPVIVALVCTFFFIGCFAFYLYHCSDIVLDAGNLTRVTTSCSSSQPQGIDPKLLDTFPILVYSAVKNLKSGKSTTAPECAVCLSEFDHNDALRLLPKCNHVFHPQCIDAWFASHVTCPVCRARLKPAENKSRQGDDEVIIVIPNEVNSREVLHESSENGRENHLLGDIPVLGRCHSTGHSFELSGIEGKESDVYNLRLPNPVTHGGMRRSSSYCVLYVRPGYEESSGENLIVSLGNTSWSKNKLGNPSYSSS